MNGTEWVVEAHGCDPVRLASVPALHTVFATIIAELDLHPVGEALWHQFPSPGGITGMQMLAESHLTVHTFPEHASLCLNLFCCTPRQALVELGHATAHTARRGSRHRAGVRARLCRRRRAGGVMTSPAPRTTSCPNCGASIRFLWAQAVQTTCQYCKAVLVRRDLDLETIGQQANFPEPDRRFKSAPKGSGAIRRFSWSVDSPISGRAVAGTSGIVAWPTAPARGCPMRSSTTP